MRGASLPVARSYCGHHAFRLEIDGLLATGRANSRPRRRARGGSARDEMRPGGSRPSPAVSLLMSTPGQMMGKHHAPRPSSAIAQPYQPYGGCESQEYLIECMLVKPSRNIRLGAGPEHFTSAAQLCRRDVYRMLHRLGRYHRGGHDGSMWGSVLEMRPHAERASRSDAALSTCSTVMPVRQA